MFKNRSVSPKNKTEQYGETISTGSTTLTRTIGTQLVIKIFGEIPEPDHPSIHEIFEQLVDPTVSEIDIIINTYGGSWNTGIMLYNMLMQLNDYCRIKTIGFGNVFSAGSIIYLAGNTRLAGHGTDFLFHSTYAEIGYESTNNSLGYLETHTKTVKRTLEDALSPFLSKEELTLILESSKNFYMNEIEAKERGIVHQVGYILPWTFDIMDNTEEVFQ